MNANHIWDNKVTTLVRVDLGRVKAGFPNGSRSFGFRIPLLLGSSLTKAVFICSSPLTLDLR